MGEVSRPHEKTSDREFKHRATFRTTLYRITDPMVKYVLEPFGNGLEYLNPISIDTASGDLELVLGRNAFTGLSDSTRPNFQFVSRRHVLIIVRNGELFVQCVATQSDVVFYNGYPFSQNAPAIRLKVHDCISLLGVKAFYNYRLRAVEEAGPVADAPQQSGSSSSAVPNTASTLTQSQPVPGLAARTQSLGNSVGGNEGSNVVDLNQSDDCVILDSSVVDLRSSASSDSAELVVVEPAVSGPSTAAAVAAPAPASIAPSASEADLMKGIVKKLLRQYECSICYETIACASSIHPCGDSFCLTCIADWATQNKAGASAASAECSCPYCQAKFTMSSVFPNRMVDGAIREILQHSPEELSAWEERLQQGNERRRQITEAAASAPPAAPAQPAARSREQIMVEMQQNHQSRRMDLMNARIQQRAAEDQRRWEATMQDPYGLRGDPFPHNPAHAAATAGRRAYAAPPPAAPARREPDVIEIHDSQSQGMDYDPFGHGGNPNRRPAPAATGGTAQLFGAPRAGRQGRAPSALHAYFARAAATTGAAATTAAPAAPAAANATSVSTAPTGSFFTSAPRGDGLSDFDREEACRRQIIAEHNDAASRGRKRKEAPSSATPNGAPEPINLMSGSSDGSRAQPVNGLTMAERLAAAARRANASAAARAASSSTAANGSQIGNVRIIPGASLNSESLRVADGPTLAAVFDNDDSSSDELFTRRGRNRPSLNSAAVPSLTEANNYWLASAGSVATNGTASSAGASSLAGSAGAGATAARTTMNEYVPMLPPAAASSSAVPTVGTAAAATTSLGPRGSSYCDLTSSASPPGASRPVRKSLSDGSVSSPSTESAPATRPVRIADGIVAVPRSSASNTSNVPSSSAGASTVARRPETSEFYAAMPTHSLPGGRYTPCARCGNYFQTDSLCVGIYVKAAGQPERAARYAVIANLASQTHWTMVCTNWYHLACIKELNLAREEGREAGEPLCFDKLALTYYLSSDEQRQLQQHWA